MRRELRSAEIRPEPPTSCTAWISVVPTKPMITKRFSLMAIRGADVRFGSRADISVCPRDVRFTPKSGSRHHQIVELTVQADAPQLHCGGFSFFYRPGRQAVLGKFARQNLS